MVNFESFLPDLQAALNHLHDPAFTLSPVVQSRLRIVWPDLPWADALQVLIKAAQPLPSAPADARSRRLHQILVYRYLHQSTQDETAQKLNITPRHLRREQNDAVLVLARQLWAASEEDRFLALPMPDWCSQLRQELTSLQRHAPAGTANVGEVLRGAVDLLAPVLQKNTIALHLQALPVHGVVAVHPAGLRQILVRCLTEWSRHLHTGEIAITAQRQDKNAVIVLTGTQAALLHLADDLLLQELLAAYQGTLRVENTADLTQILLTLPLAPALQVLVVDDNEDLLHFYQRYLQDTRYHVIPLTDGVRLLETVESVQPDVVVLDVMLPVTDGWELLSNLRQTAATRTLPVIICSVIQESELALALGATDYLEKPVRRAALIECLDRVTQRAGVESPG